MKDKQDQYLGVHTLPLVQKKDRKKRFRHPIFLYSPENEASGQTGVSFENLSQIVNIYEHRLEDFEFNSKRIIKHYVRNYGDETMGIFSLGQGITFRVYKGQKPMQLPLFAFFMNYTMLITPILMGVDMHDWVPFAPERWTSKAWVNRMDHYIKQSRPYGNMRQICDYVAWSKYLMNLFVAMAGDRIGLSISNLDFIEVAKRDEEAMRTITCTFDIPKGISPSKLEQLAKKRTTDLLNFISEQQDLPISTYTRNGLFNPGQFREFAVHIGHKPDLVGNTIPFTYATNNIMGTADPRAFVVDACGGRKAEVIKLNVSDAGALERALCMLLSNVSHVDLDYECDSQHFRKRYLDSVDTLQKLEGRVGTFDPKSDEYIIIDPDDADLVGQTIYLKTPITCTHPNRQKGTICIACYGMMMGQLNCDIHIGRIAAINSADDTEQVLLSAKHALDTNTNDVEFDEIFDQYFTAGDCQIAFNQDMIDASDEGDEEFDHLHFEFHPNAMTKKLDGESRSYDRAITEIVIYDDRDDTRTVIREKNGTPIYLSPEFVDNFYLPATKYNSGSDIVHIPFNELIDGGKVVCDVLFEYQYRNNELAGPILELEGILSKGSKINSFATYDECLDYLIPLFVKGGIHLPEFQTEMIISQMIVGEDDEPVDWTQSDPKYKFLSIEKAIQHNPSPLVSILYRESSAQLAGAYGTYEKSGTSAYDRFLWNPKRIQYGVHDK